MGDWGDSLAAESEMSDLTVASNELFGLIQSTKNITYKVLLDHMGQAQVHYDDLRDMKGLMSKEDAKKVNDPNRPDSAF